MKNQRSSRSGLLLIELILAILFFSIASAVCLQLFAKSHTLSRDAQILDWAMHQTSSAAELIQHSGNPSDTLRKYYPELTSEKGVFHLYYDQSLTICQDEKGAAYHMQITSAPLDSSTTNYQISVSQASKEEHIYSLEITAYKQRNL